MAEEIRSKIIALFETGSSKKEIFQKLKNGKVSPKLIYRTIKRYNGTGSLSDKPRSGRPRSVRTPALKNKVRCRIFRNPRRSIRKMAREFSVNHETMRKLVVEDLELKSFKIKKVHHLNQSIRTKRLVRSEALLQRFAPGVKDQILLSDEKIFTIEEAWNRQNDRILATSSTAVPENLKYIDRVQKPLSVMVWGGVSANARTNLIFVPQGVKINSATYQKLILEPEISVAGQNLFRNNTWIFQQDSAPAHASKSTQDWLREKKIEFISKDEWPPSSPDLNPLDYRVWANLEARACAKPHKSLDSLKLSLQREWQKIPQDELRNAVGKFRTRLQAVISQKGGYIE